MKLLLFKIYTYTERRVRFLGELDEAFIRGAFYTAHSLIWKTVRRNKGEFVVIGVDETHDFYIVYYFPDGIYDGAEYISITKPTLDAIKEILKETEKILKSKPRNKGTNRGKMTYDYCPNCGASLKGVKPKTKELE